MKPELPKSAAPLRVNLLLFEAFSNMVLACLLEPLRVVRDDVDAAIDWTILTHGDAVLRSSSGLRIAPDRSLSDAAPCDLLIVIGGDRFRLEAADRTLSSSLRSIRSAGTVIAADTGPWLLAAAGYLNGRRATVHWQLLTEFAETFPDVLALDDRLVRDGRWVTCGSAANALDAILEEIATRYGPAARFDAAAMFLNEPARAVSAGLPFDGALAHGHPLVRRIVTLMAAHIQAPLPLPRLARDAGISLRSMARLFERELGMSPGHYHQHLRLRHARDIALQTDLSLDQIAVRCGYSCGSSLARAHRRSYGRSLRGRA